MKTAANNRALAPLISDLMGDLKNPQKVDLYWNEDGNDPTLTIVAQAAAQDMESGFQTTLHNGTMEGGDGSPNALSNYVFEIPGGLQLIIDIRRKEFADQKPTDADMAAKIKEDVLRERKQQELEDALEHCQFSCHSSSKFTSRIFTNQAPTLAI